MVYHHVMGFNISVHYAFTMAEIQCLNTLSTCLTRENREGTDLEKLEYVVSHIVVDKLRV